MNCQSFETPITNFRRLIENDTSDQFKIIISSASQGKIGYSVSNNEARIISKKIDDLFIIDPTIDQYEIHLPKYLEQRMQGGRVTRILNHIHKSTRERVNILQEDQKIFSMLQCLLGERTSIEGEEYIENVEEAISLLNTEMEDKSIKYLSEHLTDLFDSVSTSELNEEIIISIIEEYDYGRSEREHGTQEINEIFERMKTREEDEEIIIHFILCAMNEHNHKYEFPQTMKNYIIEHLNDTVADKYLSHFTRLVIDLLSRENKFQRETNKITECKFNGKELEGIISHLKKTEGNKIKENTSLRLTGGSYPHPSFPITNIIEYDEKNINEYYYNWSAKKPSSESDSWIEFDFKERRVSLSSYTIRADADGPNCCWKPKTWRIVGSNDHEHWTVLNRQTNCSELNGSYKQHRFLCEGVNDYFRFIRYIQEDSWDSSDCKYSFSLTCFEMFGSIEEQSS